MNSLLKKLRLLLSFYLSYSLVTILITLACAFTLYKAIAFSSQPLKMLPAIVWIKVITTGIIFYYINNYQQKQFFYFQNLGLSKLFLWSCTIAFDFMLFFILLTLILN